MTVARPHRGERVLITGGAGFIGSHVAERLVARGDRVTILDDLSTGDRDNLRGVLAGGQAELRVGDVCEPIAGEFDRIYCLASPASPEHYRSDPVKTTRTCVLGAINCLELARRTGARVLLSSTSEIYGDPLVHPQEETYRGNVDTAGPRACYDEGKRCAETLFFDYERQYKVSIRVARIFNTYGPRLREGDGRVVSNFLTQALSGEPLTIYGDGRQTRSFCHVDDMVEGLIRLMDAQIEGAGAVNLGNPEEISIIDLARRCIETAGSTSSLRFLPLPVDDPRRRRPDISKAMKLLGWSPATDLANGLKRTVAWFAGKRRGTM
jgi:UDP-glucuronate decarboxylase